MVYSAVSWGPCCLAEALLSRRSTFSGGGCGLCARALLDTLSSLVLQRSVPTVLASQSHVCNRQGQVIAVAVVHTAMTVTHVSTFA